MLIELAVRWRRARLGLSPGFLESEGRQGESARAGRVPNHLLLLTCAHCPYCPKHELCSLPSALKGPNIEGMWDYGETEID